MLQCIASVVGKLPILNRVCVNVVGRSGRCGRRGLNYLKKMFHRRIGINSAVTDGLIVALLLLGEDILLSIQGFVLNFVRELIPNILNIVGAVPRCPILLQNIFPIYNFKGDGNSDMTAGSIVKASTGITKSLMKRQSVDSDQLDVVGGTTAGVPLSSC